MNPQNDGPHIIEPTVVTPDNAPSTEPQQATPSLAATPSPSSPPSGQATTQSEPAAINNAQAPATENQAPPVNVALQPDPQPTVSDPQNAAPTIIAGGSDAQPNKPKNKKRGKKFWALVSAGVFVILAGGTTYAYFGIYMSSSFVWKQSLGDMGKGYDRLVSYLNSQSSTHYMGISEEGSFKVNSSGSNFDGSVNFANYGLNNSLSAKVDLGVSKVDLEERSIKASGNSTPDVYIQLSGIKTLSNYLFGADLGSKVDSLDGKWIVVDHNLIADLKSLVLKSQQSQSSAPQLTWPEIYSFLKSASQANKKYIFTTNGKTAVLKVLKSYGKETVNGHSTYHYEVGLVPANLKAYVIDMCSTLQASDLGTYIQQKIGKPVGTSSYCKNLEKSASQIKSSETIDVWADINSRMIYKIRAHDTQNPAENFVDIGLNYKGGNTYPFFITSQAQNGPDKSNMSLTATLNTSDKSLAIAINASSSGTNNLKCSGSFNIKPTNVPLSLKAPTGAIPITTILQDFGLGSYVQQIQSMGSNSQVSAIKVLPPNNLAANHEKSGLLRNVLSTALSQIRN